MSNIYWRSESVLICSASVFRLYRLINKNISSSISTSKTVILPLLTVLILLHLFFLLPQELEVPCEKNICPWKSSRYLLFATSEECVSCKKLIPLLENFSRRHSNILIFFSMFKPIDITREELSYYPFSKKICNWFVI